TPPHSRQRRNTRNPVSTFPGEGQLQQRNLRQPPPSSTRYFVPGLTRGAARRPSGLVSGNPAIITPGTLATPTDTSIVVPVLVADLGEAANWRYAEFFTANINNDHTRRAYARACSRFFAWCENRGLSLTAIRPFDVAAWVKDLQQ